MKLKRKNNFLNDPFIRGFIQDTLSTPSASGFEYKGQKLWMEAMSPFVDTIETDSYGTAYAILKAENSVEEPKRVVIEAHCDEIAWYVHYIDPNGLIYVKKNGGSDTQIAPGKRVDIYTRSGKIIKGAFGWPAIHTRTKDIDTKVENLFIDVGALNRTRVHEMGIGVGDIAIFDDLPIFMENYICGRSIDNKIGGVSMLQMAKFLKESGIRFGFDLYFVNSVQEEVGLRGAQMIANRIKPDIAIVIDVTHHTDTPNISTKVHGDISCGKGAVLTVAPPVHNILLNKFREVAELKKIPYQMKVASRSTGTDTDSFAYECGGIPSILVSIPLKYMHTTNEMCHIYDVQSTCNLIINSLFELQNLKLKYF